MAYADMDWKTLEDVLFDETEDDDESEFNASYEVVEEKPKAKTKRASKADGDDKGGEEAEDAKVEPETEATKVEPETEATKVEPEAKVAKVEPEAKVVDETPEAV